MFLKWLLLFQDVTLMSNLIQYQFNYYSANLTSLISYPLLFEKLLVQLSYLTYPLLGLLLFSPCNAHILCSFLNMHVLAVRGGITNETSWCFLVKCMATILFQPTGQSPA
eukprot:gb/GEZN01008278.1/.p3 GENE.gb/GEZN01008278.1/~~gb/GEZN01008278.1/.p3  ORF type:complete len:110 (-),score=5.65 gb/GEZN01008278.1/:323-652(-)